MSYLSTVGGGASFGGFGYYGLSGTYPVQQESEGVQELQRELQRLGYLQRGTGVYGADGRFGPRTATALRSAARYVGWTDAPYSPSNAGEMRSGNVTIPDDLMDRLRAARPDPDAPHAGGGEPRPADAPVDPDISRGAAPPAPATREEASGRGWVPSAVIGGGVLAIGLLIAYSMYSQKKPRRNRRRRTSRRR